MNAPMNPASPGATPAASTGPNPRVVAVVLLGVAVIGALVVVLFVRGGGDDDTAADGDSSSLSLDEPTPTETTVDTTPSSTLQPDLEPDDDEPDPTETGPDTEELARAAVLLLQLDSTGEPACFSGSGSVVSADGKILTNAHVVWNDPTCPYDLLGVAVVDATDQPPSLRYLADVVAYDEVVDLAVVQVASDLDGVPVGALSLPHVALGDSDAVGLGDSLRILGFPGIGGNTITFTRGAVSGFVAERGVDDTRAWIKTDATIAGGNSGGMAVNEEGQLVAVPTTAGAGSGETATTDCRVIEDTNGDGRIDDNDSCIPIGGFINGLRPVNLALPLLADAEAGRSIEPVSPEIGPPTDFDIDDVVVENLFFAPGVTDDDQPTEVVHALPSGVERVCAFWSYTGMQDGVSYDAIWRIDGEPDTGASYLDDVWTGGESGEWWVCAINDAGLVDGLYEFELTVEGEFLNAESIFIGGDRGPASITIANESNDTVCFVYISPALSGYWGNDELGATEVIDPQSTRVFEDLVTGRYDVLLRDCSFGTLREWTGIEVTGDELLTHAG